MRTSGLPRWRRGVLGVSTLALVLVASASSGLPGTAAALTAVPTSAAAATLPVRACSSLTAVDLSGLDTRIATGAEVTLDGHRFCDVKGYISPLTQFEVLLPQATWRGDYLQQGCGGFCGHLDLSLADPSRTSGYQAPFAPLADGELVVAADDQGHETPTNVDALWAKNDPQLRVVFGYSSEHSLARTAKAITRAYYGRNPAHSYFDGVSDGGHEALDLAQRYPTDFDGILAGAPAGNWAALGGLFEPWLAHANLDPSGHPVDEGDDLQGHVLPVGAGGDAGRGHVEDGPDRADNEGNVERQEQALSLAGAEQVADLVDLPGVLAGAFAPVVPVVGIGIRSSEVRDVVATRVLCVQESSVLGEGLSRAVEVDWAAHHRRASCRPR